MSYEKVPKFIRCSFFGVSLITLLTVLIVLNVLYDGQTCKPQIEINEKLWH